MQVGVIARRKHRTKGEKQVNNGRIDGWVAEPAKSYGRLSRDEHSSRTVVWKEFLDSEDFGWMKHWQ